MTMVLPDFFFFWFSGVGDLAKISYFAVKHFFNYSTWDLATVDDFPVYWSSPGRVDKGPISP